MRILTIDQANSVAEYYSDKIIGKPITEPGDTNPHAISSLEILKINEDEYTVKCIVRIYGKILYRDLENTIKYLNLLPVEEFLSNPNL